MSVKKERIESIIKKELAPIIIRLNDPVTNDLSFAYIYVSFLDEKDKEKGIIALTKAKGMLRTEISKTLSTRRSPELIIKLDESIEQGNIIENILSEIKKEETE